MAQLNTRIVLRNDSSANWLTNESVILLKGEVGIEFAADGKVMMKIGDGVKTWAELPYFGGASETTIYEAIPEGEETHLEAIAKVVGDVELNKGDIAIVKVLIVDDKQEYTAYVHNGSTWIAMDGNYNAENVYLDSNLTITADIGVQSLNGAGSKVLNTAGKNLKQVLDMILAARSLPTYEDPAVSITCPQAGEYEVGTSITPSYTASLSTGSYQYGPEDTEIIASAWEVSFNGAKLTTASGSFDALDVTDGMNIRMTAVAAHNAGVAPVDNLGETVVDATELASCQIPAGNKTGYSGYIKGYRNSFYASSIDAIELNSDNIRAMTAKKSSNNSLTVNVVEGAKFVSIAVPSGRKVTKVADKNAFGTDIFSEFTKSEVTVAGAASGFDKSYNVYVYAPSAALSANTYTVTVANE